MVGDEVRVVVVVAVVVGLVVAEVVGVVTWQSLNKPRPKAVTAAFKEVALLSQSELSMR